MVPPRRLPRRSLGQLGQLCGGDRALAQHHHPGARQVDHRGGPAGEAAAAILDGSGPNGLPPVYFRVLSYQAGSANSGNMAWTGMSGGPYTMYVVTSDNNPFDTAGFGTITSYTIYAEVPSWEGWMALAVLALLGLLL